MNVSDIVALIGLTLAILAFLSNSEREFILIKLSRRDFFILLLSFIYINFLVFYEWWNGKIKILDIFHFNDFPEPKTWAYILSLLTIGWFIRKLFFSKFPSNKESDLIKYYKELLLQGDYVKVLNFIKRYNLDHINCILTEEKNKLNTYLLKYLLPNKDFIRKTESINTSLYLKIFEKSEIVKFKSLMLNNYLQVQFEQSDSILNIDLLDGKDFLDEQNFVNQILKYKNQIDLPEYIKSLASTNFNNIGNLIIFNHLLTKSILNDNDDDRNYIVLQKETLKVIMTLGAGENLIINYFKKIGILITDHNPSLGDFTELYDLLLDSILTSADSKTCDGYITKVIELVIKISISIEDIPSGKGNLLEIRNSCFQNKLTKYNKDLIRTMKNVMTDKYLSYNGDFKINVIDVISNY